jgi:hypothetical protein
MKLVSLVPQGSFWRGRHTVFKSEGSSYEGGSLGLKATDAKMKIIFDSTITF